jgi:uncharacterized protein YbjT (DUF2867 family)
MAVDSTHVIFGATGGIGGALVAELMRRGKTVRAVSRRGEAPEGAEGAAADAADAAAAAAAARGAGVVYHCVNPGTRGGQSFCPRSAARFLAPPSHRVPSLSSPTT